jgi:hypothetical protein
MSRRRERKTPYEQARYVQLAGLLLLKMAVSCALGAMNSPLLGPVAWILHKNCRIVKYDAWKWLGGCASV